MVSSDTLSQNPPALDLELSKALMCAADVPLSTVQALLARGACPNIEVGEDKTAALIRALQARRHDLCAALIEAGADVNKPILKGITPLMAASAQGSKSIVRLLLDKGAAVGVKEEASGQTALCFAATAGHLMVVEELLGAGADPETQDDMYHVPLSERVFYAVTEIEMKRSEEPPNMKELDAKQEDLKEIMTILKSPEVYMHARQERLREEEERLRAVFEASVDKNLKLQRPIKKPPAVLFKPKIVHTKHTPDL